MEERQALRIDYAHGTVPGTAFVIDEPFPIPPCAPRVPSAGGTVSALGGGTAALGVGLPSAGAWCEPQQLQLPPQRRDEPPWMGRDWQTQQQPFFPDIGRFQGVDGPARRPNGSYMRGSFQGLGGRGGRPGTNFEDGGGVDFLGGLGRRPGTGGFQGPGFTGRQRGGPDGGRGRGIGSDATDSFRRGGDRGQAQRRPMSRGMRGDGGAPRGRGRGTGGPAAVENRGSQAPRGRGRLTGGPAAEGNRGSQSSRGRGRSTGGPAPEEKRGSQPPRGRGRSTGGPAPEEKRGSQLRGRGRGAGEPAPEENRGSPPPTSQPLPFSLGNLLSQKPPAPGKRPQGSNVKNRLHDANDSGSSPAHPPWAKNHSTGGKFVPSEANRKSPHKDGVRKSPAKTGSRRSPRKSSSKPRSPRDSSSRTRSPGGKRSSRARSSSKSGSRRSRSRSRRYRSRSRSPHRHRSKSGSPHKNRSPRITRSPYRTSSLLPGQEEGFGIRVVGFPVWISDVRIQDELYHEFKRHGKVVSIDMYGCLDDRYAVVFYLLSSEREAALVAFKDHCFFGRCVHLEPWDSSAVGAELRSWESDASFRPLDDRADEFHPRATKILFVGNLEKTLTREDLSAVFNRYGEVLGIDLKKMVGLPNRFAFIQYIDIAGVCRAIKAMDGELLRNTRVRLGFGRSKSTNCVWVDGLPGTLTEAQLTAHFSAHGTVLKLSFDSAKGVALVFFKTVEQAEAALQEARGQTVGGNRIKVDFANARSQAAFYRVIEPGPEDGVDVEPEEKPAAPVQDFKSSDIEAGDVLRKVLLV